MSDIPLYLATFNVNKRAQSKDALGASLAASLPAIAPKLLVFGFEELCSIYESFFPATAQLRLQELGRIIEDAVSVHYKVKVTVISRFTHGALGLLVLGVNAHTFSTRNHQFGKSSCGILYSSLKGGCATRFEFRDHSTEEWTLFSFATFHLAANQGTGYMLQRDEDFKYLVRTLEFKNAAWHEDAVQSFPSEETLYSPNPLDAPSTTYEGLFKPGSHVFIMGDLNYRTVINPFTVYDKDPPPPVAQLLDTKMQPGVTTSLQDGDCAFYHPSIDELALSLTNSNGWLRNLRLREAKITFRPTYKFKLGAVDPASNAQIYHADEAHRPSWCDRILFLNTYTHKVTINRYHKITGLVDSDHQPVFLDLAVPYKAPASIVDTEGMLEMVSLPGGEGEAAEQPLVAKRFGMQVEGWKAYLKHVSVASDAVLAYVLFFFEYKVGWLVLLLLVGLIVCTALDKLVTVEG